MPAGTTGGTPRIPELSARWHDQPTASCTAKRAHVVAGVRAAGCGRDTPPEPAPESRRARDDGTNTQNMHSNPAESKHALPAARSAPMCGPAALRFARISPSARPLGAHRRRLGAIRSKRKQIAARRNPGIMPRPQAGAWPACRHAGRSSAPVPEQVRCHACIDVSSVVPSFPPARRPIESSLKPGSSGIRAGKKPTASRAVDRRSTARTRAARVYGSSGSCASVRYAMNRGRGRRTATASRGRSGHMGRTVIVTHGRSAVRQNQARPNSTRPAPGEPVP